MKRKFKKAILRKARKSIDVMADLMKVNQKSFSTIERWVIKGDRNLNTPESLEILTSGLSVTELELFEQ